MAALEDKTYRGAGIASPSMAWVWGQIAGYSGPYHLVWSRDLYQVATAQIAAGDRAAAGRALDHLWELQQQPDGCFPQNANLDGTPHWPNLQLDEVADPILLAGSSAAPTRRPGATCAARRSASSRAARSPRSAGRTPTATRPRRSAPRSPGSCARRRSPSATARPPTRRATARSPTTGGAARRWTRHDERSALGDRRTSCGSASTGTPTPARRTRSATAARRSTSAPSSTRASSSSCGSACARRRRGRRVDAAGRRPRARRRHAVRRFWHRYSHDGYGETPDGGPFPDPATPGGRGRSSRASAASTSWPRASCRRGARRAPPPARLDAIAATGERRAHAARAGVGRESAVRRARLRARRRGPAPPRRSAGRTRSSCGSRGRSTPAGRSSGRASSAAATAVPVAERDRAGRLARASRGSAGGSPRRGQKVGRRR